MVVMTGAIDLWYLFFKACLKTAFNLAEIWTKKEEDDSKASFPLMKFPMMLYAPSMALMASWCYSALSTLAAEKTLFYFST